MTREAFREAEYLWLAPATVFAVGAIFFRSVRWRALLHPLELRLRQLFGFVLVGYTVNTLLPLRAGDIARSHLFGQAHGESRMRASSTIAVEHLLDAVVVLCILLALAPFLTFPDWAETAKWTGVGIVIASSALIGWLWMRREQSLFRVERIADRVPLLTPASVREKLDSIIEGFSALRSRKASAIVVSCSLLSWLSGGMMMWIVLIAFGLPHSFQAAMFLVSMSAVALAIPSSPGFVGVYHALLIGAATLVLDVEAGAAAGFAVATHLLLFVPPVVLGAGYMLLYPGVWNDLLHWRRQHSEQDAISASAERHP